MHFLIWLLLIGLLCAMATRIAIVRLFLFFVIASMIWHFYKGA